MKCPFCNKDDTQVIDSRVIKEGTSIRRRRSCPGCEKRFTTYEHIELSLPQVVKQDGKREEFNKEKLHHSLNRALHKRPVPVEFIDHPFIKYSVKNFNKWRKRNILKRFGRKWLWKV